MIGRRAVLTAMCALAGTAAAQTVLPAENPVQLLRALRAAPDQATAASIERRLVRIWTEAGGPAATLLMHRGLRDLEHAANAEAVKDFSAALALAPRLAEAYRRRAIARAGLGDGAGALADLAQALAIEPRDFAAFATLSIVAERDGDAKGALAAWRRVLAISPRTAGAAVRLRLLERAANGQST